MSEDKNGQQEEHVDIGRQIPVEAPRVSRRDFLKMAGMAGATVGVGAGLGGLLAGCSDDVASVTTTSATTATTATTATSVSSTTTSLAPGEPVFTVLDPRAVMADIEYEGLQPRLDTIDGKKIVVVNLHGGNEDAQRSIAPALQAQYPKCEVTLHEASGMWRMEPPEIEMLAATFDGAILGENY